MAEFVRYMCNLLIILSWSIKSVEIDVQII